MPRWWRPPRAPNQRRRNGFPCPPCCRPTAASTLHARRPPDRRDCCALPPMRSVPAAAAKAVAQRGRDQQDREHFEEITQLRRILEWVRRVDVEEPAAVGAELLDRD